MLPLSSLPIHKPDKTPHARPEPTAEPVSAPSRSGIALVIAIILAPLACILVFHSEIVYHSADLASISLTFAAVWVLLVLIGIRMLFPRISRRSILLIYATVAGTVGISTMGMVQFLITTLLAPFYFNTPANRFQEFWGSIPAWAAPRSQEVVKGFFLGHSSLYNPAIWKAWVVPVIAWGGFLAALLTAQYCLAHLMYPRWSREERLTFPTAQIPLTLTETSGSTRWALVLGALVAIVIQGLNALHFLYPWVPGINVLPVDVGPSLPQPWNYMGPVWLTFYPCIIGLSALVPTNILFSGVFFHALTKFENLAAHNLGLASTGIGFPYAGEQGQGAVFAFALVVLWSAKGALRKSLSNQADRWVWMCLIVSFAVLFCYGGALGLRPVISLMLFGLFLLFMIGTGWMRAAVGQVWNLGNDVAWWARAFGGGTAMGEGVGLAYLRWFSFGDFRAHALPTYADTFKLAESAKIDRRQLLTTLAVGSFLSIVASLWVALDVYYRHGAATALTDQWRTYQGRIAFETLRSYLDGVTRPPGLPQIEAVIFGMMVVVALQVATTRLLWWPLHPAGFVLAQVGCLEWMWLPMLIAAVAKTILLRTGGLKLYRRAVPFFIGLVLGDYTISAVLTLLRFLLDKPMYKTFPIS